MIETSGEKFARRRDWVEPAHPRIVRLHDDLLAIYRYIREKYQEEIDKAFDRASRQIGFVVTTTLPVMLEIGDKGTVKRFGMGESHLKDTLFDRELTTATKSLVGKPISSVSPGTYNLYLLWFEALKLKLWTHWMEPAHFRREHLVERAYTEKAQAVQPEVREPAHWFDPGRAIDAEEAVVISVIDEVYPELQLSRELAASRASYRWPVGSEVREPAHYRPSAESKRSSDELVRRLKGILDEYEPR